MNNFYENMDNIDIDSLLEDYPIRKDNGSFIYPEDKRVQLEINGKKLYVYSFLGSDLKKITKTHKYEECYDGNSLSSSLDSEHKTKIGYLYYKNIDEVTCKNRDDLLLAIAHIINKESVLKDLGENAAKTKNGFFNKKSVVKIFSNLVIAYLPCKRPREYYMEMIRIYAKAAVDMQLEIHASRGSILIADVYDMREGYVATHATELGLDKYIK